MATSSRRAKQPRRAPARRKSAQPKDAIALLKGDHREVEGWFKQFESTRSDQKKLDLAQRICGALKAHTTIEEEIFYPAYLEATTDQKMHHEAEVEHDGAKKLIAEIERSEPSDEYYDARVKVLSEMIKHHVKEEEKSDGMFARARKAKMDLEELGAHMAARKQQLIGDGGRTSKTRAAMLDALLRT